MFASSSAQAEPRQADQHQAEVRGVIELFTSQGCSSCPAADKLMGEYARDPSVIALSLAVGVAVIAGGFWLAGTRDTARATLEQSEQRPKLQRVVKNHAE